MNQGNNKLGTLRYFLHSTGITSKLKMDTPKQHVKYFQSLQQKY